MFRGTGGSPVSFDWQNTGEPPVSPGFQRSRFAFCPFTKRMRPRGGFIFFTAMWVLVILAALVLVFARSMRTEVMISGNHLADSQASTIELGAENYVLAAVDASNGDALTVLQTPAEQIQLNNGYFWILQPYFQNDYQYAFGITDETSKLPLNTATDAQLAALPGITQDVADSIVDWRDADENITGQGAESAYYGTQPRPYSSKNSPFESVAELYLVKNMTDDLMWGMDLNHNGVLDPVEQQAGGLATAFNAGNDSSRGIAPFVTVWGEQPNTSASGKPRVNISMINDPTQLRTALLTALSTSRVNQIVAQAMATRQFRNIFDFAIKTKMKSSELAQVEDLLTSSPAKTLSGKVNVNTTSEQVLMCLGLQQSDADAIINQQPTAQGSFGNSATSSVGTSSGSTGTSSAASPTTSISWIMDVLKPQQAVQIGDMLTGKSYFYSADIVAVTADGRSFRRVRIVVDARSSPPLIVYRKDLTSMGWPLSDDIRTALRTGQPLPPVTGYGTGGGNGLGM